MATAVIQGLISSRLMKAPTNLLGFEDSLKRSALKPTTIVLYGLASLTAPLKVYGVTVCFRVPLKESLKEPGYPLSESV